MRQLHARQQGRVPRCEGVAHCWQARNQQCAPPPHLPRPRSQDPTRHRRTDPSQARQTCG
eukprot:5071035-Alexandrium_andersonii.AAC.1